MQDTMLPLILASGSPRRLELLEQIGLYPRVVTADIDESPVAGEAVDVFVQRLALEKAQKVASLPEAGAAVILAADTVGVLNNELLLKPRSKAHAFAMWTAMSNQWHEVLTAIAVVADDQHKVLLHRSNVRFATVSPAAMEVYWQTGEPQDKAGAYAIQGRAAVWVERIEGSYSSIMGLPLYETAALLKQFGCADLL